MRRRTAWLAGCLLLLSACANDAANGLGSDDDGSLNPMLGGGTTRADATVNAFGLPAANLEREERRRFEVGDSFFTQKWVTAPASTDKRDGLGPTFNATACGSCHVNDGRAQPPGERSGEPGLLLRLSLPGDVDEHGMLPGVDGYGGQLQDDGILGVEAEGRVEISYEQIDGSYADGSEWTLEKPTYEIADAAFGAIPPDVMISPRVAPPVFGAGLLEAIPESDITAREDPDDADGDGVSGRANRVWDQRAGSFSLGRLGWKANQPSVEQQVAGAFLGDIGITSSLNPTENCPPIQFGCSGATSGGSPEIGDELLSDVVFYNRTLSVPAMRDHDDAQVVDGAKQFSAVGCASCHVPRHQTGDVDIAALSDQEIYPYSDLLLHDMGEDLADGRPDFDADGREWRTPPLWGVGLTDEINGHTRFLHDGRARSLEEAILWHGGEAEQSLDRFLALDRQQRDALLAFLDAL